MIYPSRYPLCCQKTSKTSANPRIDISWILIVKTMSPAAHVQRIAVHSTRYANNTPFRSHELIASGAGNTTIIRHEHNHLIALEVPVRTSLHASTCYARDNVLVLATWFAASKPRGIWPSPLQTYKKNRAQTSCGHVCSLDQRSEIARMHPLLLYSIFPYNPQHLKHSQYLVIDKDYKPVTESLTNPRELT